MRELDQSNEIICNTNVISYHILDTATICNGVTSSTYNLAAFPYDCHKFVNCTSGSFVEVKTVSYNIVYNPANGQVTPPAQLPCATLVGKIFSSS